MRSRVVDFRSLRRQKEKEVPVYKLDAITRVYVRAEWNEFEKRVRVRGRVGADLRVRPGCAFPQEGAHNRCAPTVSSYGLFVLMPTTTAVPQLLRRDNRD